MTKVVLGFTVPGGEPYQLPIHHMAITGMSDLSGKTTAAEAILQRSKTKALVFLTKRGEKTFADAETIPPFYKPRYDWRYVRSLLEAAMKERLKFETPWIMRVCKLAQTSLLQRHEVVSGLKGLIEVRKILGAMLESDKHLRDIDKNMFTLLAGYMDETLPVFERSEDQFSSTLVLKPGLNVMDLMPWYTHMEVQMLSMRACMEQILEQENDTQVAIPESWKVLPQGRMTPVKLYFEQFIREGATNNNYLLLDAQDLGGVDKTMLRQISIWIMGKMMEANEVERLLKQTLGLKISAEEIQTLPLGHFIVANGVENTVEKVYVWPWGVPEEMAKAVARGEKRPEEVKAWLIDHQKETMVQAPLLSFSETDLEQRVDALERLVEGSELRILAEVSRIVKESNYTRYEGFQKRMDDLAAELQRIQSIGPIGPTGETVNLEEKTLVFNVSHGGEIEVKLTTNSKEGQMMYCIVKELPKEGFSTGELRDRLAEHAWVVKDKTLSAKLSILTSGGRLIKTERGYRLPTKAKFNIQE